MNFVSGIITSYCCTACIHIHTHTHTHIHTHTHTHIHTHTHTDMCDDVSPLYDQLYPARTTWYNIGLKLNINSDDLSAIREINSQNLDTCLREMLIKRLHSGVPLSWRDVCDCLRSPTVDRKDVAKKIEEWRIGTQI